MSDAPHLLLAVSGHGYGHLAQSAPVVNALMDRLPGLRLTVVSQLPYAMLKERLAGEFAHRSIETDPTLRMSSAWKVDVPASRQVFAAFHADWETALQGEVELLHDIAPDLVLANIPYRLLLAAEQAGIPAVGLCSLNWAAVYAAYCGSTGASVGILEQVWSGYRAVKSFLAPAPALSMPELDSYRGIGPIARQGERRHRKLLEEISVPKGSRVVLVALGGIPSRLPLEVWPRIAGVYWLLPLNGKTAREEMRDLDALPLSFIEVLASADAVLTKPGYGTYTEAACNDVPVLTIARPDWPETPFLNGWLKQHGRLQEITAEQFYTGAFADALESLWQQSAGSPPLPTGIGEAADILYQEIMQIRSSN